MDLRRGLGPRVMSGLVERYYIPSGDPGMSRPTRHADGNIAILKISKYLNAKVKIYKLWSDVHFHCAMHCTLVPYICICCDESGSYNIVHIT